MKLDTTKYASMVANAAARVKISSTIFKNFIADVKSVIDGNDDVVTAHLADYASHVAENAIDSHGPMPAARVYNNASISVASGSDTALTFNAERFDTDTIHDTATNPSRLTCKTAGKYQITGNILFANNSTGLREVSIRLNGTTYISRLDMPATSSSLTLSVTTLYELNVNDYVELMAFQNSGVALNVTQAGNISPEFMMVKVG